MTLMDNSNKSPANSLCKACGLCCTGHLFIWVKLRPAELDPAEALGMNVFRSDPAQRGFSQPCPLWNGQCTVYDSPHYPRACRTYKCKLLKEVMRGETSLPDALGSIEEAKGMIQELELSLPGSSNMNFRERLVAYLEGPGNTNQVLRHKAETLLVYYEQVFGVDDLIEKADDS